MTPDAASPADAEQDAPTGTGTGTDIDTDTDSARLLAERLLATVREDIGRADTKAAILLSTALALPALLLGRPTGSPGAVATVLLAVGGALWAVGTGALVRAILPRTGTVRGRGDMTYFGDLLTATDPKSLTARVVEAGRDPLAWLLVQAVDVSTILAAKYRWIRWSVACLAPGAALAAAGLLLI
ncbi:Pycsar system effector family protein [Kitasatospora azatica]|uniref:Pycsar system effector family protein n=1 Tax=Kitasatospora azatica TaxID=58347 RepID=UPI000AF3C5BB|nr:Pycsar system effector family protein [Kitasatospora azatica]